MGHKVKQSLMSSRIDFFYYAFRNVLLISIPLLVVSALILGFSIPHSSATVGGTSADSLTLSLPTSCTLSSVVNSAHNATLISGTYTSDIGKTTITTLCNDGNGYAIYASGISNSIVGNNTLISSVSDNHNIATGIYEQGDTTSSWAMKLGNIESDTSPTPPVIEQGYNNTYGLVPSTWTKVAGRQSGTTDMITGSTFTTTYAVYTAPTQHAGTYTGQVAYALIHGTGDNSPPIYIMQDVASWKNSLQLEESVQAIDMRDNKLYWVTKLKDGNIWMTQNLDFDIDSTRTYTHNDTDLGWDPNNFNINAIWTPDTTNGKYNLPVNGTSILGWATRTTYPYSADPGDVYYYTSNSISVDTKYDSLSACIAAGHTEGDCKHYHAGNYYNWTAAIASNNSSSLTEQYSNAPNSICPKGWRLPIATNANQSVYEFGELLFRQDIVTTKINNSYAVNGFNNIRKSPLWFARGGTIDSGSLGNLLTHGYYYSSTITGDSAYFLKFGSASIQTAHSVSGYGKSNGMSVRCLAR